MVTAVIMAGGKGTRMKLRGEKPLIMVKGNPLIGYVINALEDARRVDEVVVATSKHTPKTASLARKLGLRVIETPAAGYVDDLNFILSKPDLHRLNEVILTVTSDLPLVSAEIIDLVLGEYEKCGKPALCVAVPVEIFKKHGLVPSMVMGGVVPSGLNILSRNNKEQDEEVLILGKIELALNINSPEDLIFLEEFLGNRV